MVVILVIPLLWWWRAPRRLWRNLNLTAIWYLVPIAKTAHVLLFLMGNRFFYGAWFVSGSSASDQITLEKAGDYLDRIVNVYSRTFVAGWGEAMNAISQNSWAAPTVATLALTGLAAAILARDAAEDDIFRRPKKIAQATLTAFLLILPAIGVLMWFSAYARSNWQIYTFVPIGAATCVLGLLALAASVIRRVRLRQALIICISLLLIWPGLSRLYLQQWQHHLQADAKARVLQQIVEQAPAFEEGAYVMLFTTMQASDLGAKGVHELNWNVFDSALYILYQERRPLAASLCIHDHRCSRYDTILRFTNRDFLSADEDYHDVVIFQLHEDLRVELLLELPPELRERAVNRYDPERFIDASAPLPPRARSLLASAWRE